MQPSRAAQIPEELFKYFLEGAQRIRTEDRRERKRHFAVFGSVNRYWACQCRVQLFEGLLLRTPADAKGFGEILNTPTLPGFEPVAAMVKFLEVHPSSRDEPWLHQIFFMFSPKLVNLLTFTVLPRHSEKKELLTLHPLLPRTLPAPVVQIEFLELGGLHFSTGSALFRLLSSIPSLLTFTAVNLTFDTEPKPKDFVTTLPVFPRRLVSKAVSNDIQLCHSVIPLFIPEAHIADGRRRRRPSVMNEDDLEVLWDLIKVFGTASHAVAVEYSSSG